MFRIVFIIGVLAGTAAAYVPADPTWNAANVHRPVNLSWSLVRNGTTIPDTRDGVSNLISYLDGKLGAGPGGTNLTLRPWFRFFQDSFDRWEELGGINFTYSAQDDGSAPLRAAGASERPRRHSHWRHVRRWPQRHARLHLSADGWRHGA